MCGRMNHGKLTWAQLRDWLALGLPPGLEEIPQRFNVAPILAIAGGAMARSRNMAAGVLMLASAVGMQWAFGFGVFTMFPIAMCVLGGILALFARQPDAH